MPSYLLYREELQYYVNGASRKRYVIESEGKRDEM